MPRPASSHPTEVEMQILQILWELGPSPVREIHKRLEAAKGTNYSTTVKMLAVMLQKGLVKRNEKAQPHVYRPAFTRAKTGKRLLDDLIEKGLRRIGNEPGIAGIVVRQGDEGGSRRGSPHARPNGGQVAMLKFLAESSWANEIGWVLIHSLWQFALVAILALLLQKAMQRRSAATRYCALLATMLVLVAVPLATWFSSWSVDVPSVTAAISPIKRSDDMSRPQGAERQDDKTAVISGVTC